MPIDNIIHHQSLPKDTILDSRYKIISILGYGSFGITYLALFTRLNQKVVIKEYFPNELAHRDSSSTVIPTSSQVEHYYKQGKDRFLFEAQTLAKFNHLYIVRVTDYFDDNNTAYLVMDYEEGETLGDLLSRENSMGEERVLSIIVPILEALNEIHSQNIYHRDIKPDNIYIRSGGEPMLIDFGAAKESYQKGSKASSFNPQTAGYSAPEQATSASKYIGAHTDIYAIGAVLHKIVKGHTPSKSSDRSNSIINEDIDTYIPLATENIDGYSPKFLSLIDWALSFKSKERPHSAVEFRDALMACGVAREIKTHDKVVLKERDDSSIKLSNQKKNIKIISDDIVEIDGLMYQNQPPRKTFLRAEKRYSWEEAKKYAKNLRLGGYNDWRLPTRGELYKIATAFYGEFDKDWREWYDANKNKLNTNSEGNTHFVIDEMIEIMPTYSWFWASNEYDSSSAWIVGFNNGNDNWGDKSNRLYTLCVRG